MAGSLGPRMPEPNPAPTPYPWQSESQLASVLRNIPENIQRLFRYRLFGDQEMRNVLRQFAMDDLNGLLHVLDKKDFRLCGEQKVEEILEWPQPFLWSPFHIVDADSAASAIYQAVQVPFEAWVQRVVRYESPAVDLFMKQYQELSAQLVSWKGHNPEDFESLCKVSLCNPFTSFHDANRIKTLEKKSAIEEEVGYQLSC